MKPAQIFNQYIWIINTLRAYRKLTIDLLDYSKKAGTPIGDHIDRVGQVFYEAA